MMTTTDTEAPLSLSNGELEPSSRSARVDTLAETETSAETSVMQDPHKALFSRIVHVPVSPHASALKVVPPINFAMVEAHVFRSGRPSSTNIPFLHSLGLQSIIYLSDAKDSKCNIEFAEKNKVKYFHFQIKENKEPFCEIDEAELAKALVAVVDIRNHPMLIYSDRGKHRIGCLVGCLRKLQRWSMASIFDEYQRFSGSKIYIADQEFIEIFSAPVNYDRKYLPKWMLGFH